MLAYKFVTWGHPVWILTGTQFILMEENCGFLQPLQSNSRTLLQLGQDSALPYPFRFVMQKPLYSNMILTANYRTHTWFPKKLVCTVAVFSDCHASVRQRNSSYLVVSVEAFIQLVKLFFREWWAALLKSQWFTWANLRECALMVSTALLTLAAAVLWRASRLESLWRVLAFQRAAVSYAALSEKFPYCVILFGLLKMWKQSTFDSFDMELFITQIGQLPDLWDSSRLTEINQTQLMHGRHCASLRPPSVYNVLSVARGVGYLTRQTFAG